MSVPLGSLLGHLRGMNRGRASATDAELLRGFSSHNDPGAFAALVERHGPMVYRVCRRVLHHEQDAEDAFQATFLVLTRSATAVQKGEALASWLHGVACRMAANAKRAAARRRTYERNARTAPVPGPNETLAWREVQSALDEEVRRLPEKYRAVFVPCCLEGESRADVARNLGEKEVTVSSRLAEARKLLRRRLARRGIALSAVLTAVALSQGTGRSVPAALIRSAVQTADTAARGAVAGVSQRVLALAGHGGASGLCLKLSAFLLVLLAAGLVVGAGARADPPEPAGAGANPTPEARGYEPERTDRHGDPLPDGAVARIGTLRFRHGGGRINRVLLNPDGKTLVSKSFYGESSVLLWDMATGRMLRRFPGHFDENRAVALSPDGKTLALGQGGVIHLYDPATGRELRQFKSPFSDTGGIAFSPDGKVLASGHIGVTVLLWDLASGTVQARLAAKHGRSTLLAFSPNGKTLVTGDTNDPLVRLFDAATGTERYQVKRPSDVLDAAFSPDSTTLALGAQDGDASLWDVATGKLVRELHGPNKYVRSLVWSPDGKTLAAGDLHSEKNAAAIRLWDPTTGKELRRMQMKEVWGLPEGLAFTADGRTLVSGGWDSVIRLWDPATGLEKSPAAGLPGAVWHLAVSPDGKTLAYSTLDIALWNLAAGREIGTLPGYHWSFAFSPDSKTLAGGDNENALNVWDVAGQRLLRRVEIDVQKERLKWVAFDRVAYSPDGKTLTTGGREYDGTGRNAVIRLWDTATGRELRRYDVSDKAAEDLSTIENVAFSPDGSTLVASGRAARQDGFVRMWDATGDQERSRPQTVLNGSLAKREETLRLCYLKPRIAYSPDGRLLAMNRSEAAIPVWEAVTGSMRCQLKGHEGPTSAVTFSPDGRTLASAGWDETIRVWDVETAQELKRVTGHRGKVNALAFTPDGHTLISAGDDTTVLFWDVRELTRRPRPAVRLDPSEWDALWADLASTDAGKAHAALARLASAPAVTVPALRARLRPTTVPDTPGLAQLVRDLEAEEFAAREKASRELARLGEAAEPALKRARPDASPEGARRLDELLKKLAVPSGDGLRDLRAVEVLERIGTPEAGAVLESLSRGADQARLTRDAKAAHERLARSTGKR